MASLTTVPSTIRCLRHRFCLLFPPRDIIRFLTFPLHDSTTCLFRDPERIRAFSRVPPIGWQIEKRVE